MEHQRPDFAGVLAAWKGLLAERGYSPEVVWLFEENLCFEADPAGAGGVRLGYQTRFTPPPPGAEQLAYEYFCEHPVRLVWYRVGSAGGKSLCVMLGDDWFEKKGEAEGYVRRDEWQMSFFPGAAVELEEVTDPVRWKARLVRNRPLHDLDFCMTLQAVHESLAHGRVLSGYEHFALRFLHLWKRMLGGKEKS